MADGNRASFHAENEPSLCRGYDTVYRLFQEPKTFRKLAHFWRLERMDIGLQGKLTVQIWQNRVYRGVKSILVFLSSAALHFAVMGSRKFHPGRECN